MFNCSFLSMPNCNGGTSPNCRHLLRHISISSAPTIAYTSRMLGVPQLQFHSIMYRQYIIQRDQLLNNTNTLKTASK